MRTAIVLALVFMVAIGIVNLVVWLGNYILDSLDDWV
jgi:hypothetical protein